MRSKASNILKRIKHKVFGAGPAISVIIPFFNVENYIEECLDSVLAQKGVTTEIILVDDGSTDRSAEIVRTYVQKHDNIRMYSTPEKGPGYARNYGVRRARGEYIAFLDADDVLVKGIYRRMLRAARNNDAEVCICNAARFNAEKVWSSDLHNKVYREYRTVTNIKETPSLIFDTCVWNKLIRRDFYKKNDFVIPEDVVYEDISFNIDLHMKCKRVVMLAETGYLWRVREDRDNRSLTQLHYSDRNVRDRFTASEWLVRNVLEKDVPEELKEETRFKLLITDLRVILSSFEYVSPEKARETFAEVSAFIDKYISNETMMRLPVAELQKYEYAREGNVEGYAKLLAYINDHYDKAPVEESDGRLTARLPDDIFTVEKRDLYDEFARMPRRTYVDWIKVTEDHEIEVKAHIYIQRYDMGGEQEQDIKVLLVSEETDTEIELQTKPIRTPFLTRNFGEVYDEISGEMIHYNYDNTGFAFYINEELLNSMQSERSVKYTVVIRYEDRMFSGKQILKGFSEENRELFEKKKISAGSKTARMRFGEAGELFVMVKDNSGKDG